MCHHLKLSGGLNRLASSHLKLQSDCLWRSKTASFVGKDATANLSLTPNHD